MRMNSGHTGQKTRTDNDVFKHGRMLLQRHMDAPVLATTPSYFSSGPAGRAAWKTVQEHALSEGVELTIRPNGSIQARGGSAQKRYCAQDRRWYTLAETMEFAFEQGADYTFVMRMWEQMWDATSRIVTCDSRAK